MHPPSKHWQFVDYIIVRIRDRQNVKVTKAVCGAECWTDHRFITSKMNLHIKPRRRPQGSKTKKINVAKLKDPPISTELSNTLESQLTDFHPDGSAEED